MKLILVSIMALNVYCSYADDHCVAGEGRAYYSEKAKEVKNYKFTAPTKSHMYAEESYELADGTSVKVSNGGCAHFDRSVTFKTKPIQKKDAKFENQFWIAKAHDLLGKLPGSNEHGRGIQSQLKELEKILLTQTPHKDGDSRTIEASDSDGFNTVRLKVTQTKDSTEVEVGVNTAL